MRHLLDLSAGLNLSFQTDASDELADAADLFRRPLDPDCDDHLRAIGDLRKIAWNPDVCPAQRAEATMTANRMAQKVLVRFRRQFGFS